MNNFLDVRNLFPEQKSNDLPIPLEFDETDYSYLTRVMLLTAATDRHRVVEKFFGNRSCPVEKPLHAGFDEFAQHFTHPGSAFCDDVLEKHSMLSLFKPFANPVRYQHARRLAMSSRGSGLHELLGARGAEMFRPQPAICLDCVKTENKIKPFSHYRRFHQVLAVSHCAYHHNPLIDKCQFCGKSFSHWNLPSSSCHHCGKELSQVIVDPESDSNSEHKVRLSQVIADVFAGRITPADENIRREVIRIRTKEVVLNRSGIIGDNLATYINKMFGQTFLALLGLPTNTAPTLGWPALLIHGRLLIHDPVANCVLIAALFNSIEHYNEAINARMCSPENNFEKPKLLKSTSNISFSMMRNTLRAPSLNFATRQHGLGNNQLKKWFAAYPGLSERRAKFLLNHKLRNYKSLIQKIVIDEPGVTRNEASKTLGTELGFVKRHDPKWLDELIPIQKIRTHTATEESFESSDLKDLALCAELTQAITKERSCRRRPVRLKMSNVIRLSGLNKMPAEIRIKYPKTLNLAHQFSETMDEYFRRCLQWAAKNLAWQYGSCENITELFVHARVSIEYVKPLESFARSLLDHSKPNC